jgi:LysR family glycine cleavage system transcriptional activator
LAFRRYSAVQRARLTEPNSHPQNSCVARARARWASSIAFRAARFVVASIIAIFHLSSISILCLRWACNNICTNETFFYSHKNNLTDMSDRLPPLTALRAFEAAARHLSFASAAAELNVTPAALSFQIKSLEAHFGAPLFRRLNRAVELTEAGAALAPGTTDGFQTLAVAWRAAQRTQDHQSLTVTAGPAFTAKWLAPRLYEFAQTHPEIELRFSASLRKMDFARDSIDVAIRFGTSVDPELYALPLAEEWVTPVMTPEMAKRYPTPASLRDAPLIIDESITFLDPPTNWDSWFAAVGLAAPTMQGPRFSQADHATDAALAGAGVVLGRRALVIKDLAEGRLVAPYNAALATGARFWFLCPKSAQDRPQIVAFKEWIMREINKTSDIADSTRIISRHPV